MTLPSNIKDVTAAMVPLGVTLSYGKPSSYKSADGYFVVYRDVPTHGLRESYDSNGTLKRIKAMDDGTTVLRIERDGFYWMHSFDSMGYPIQTKCNAPQIARKENVVVPVDPERLAKLVAMLKPYPLPKNSLSESEEDSINDMLSEAGYAQREEHGEHYDYEHFQNENYEHFQHENSESSTEASHLQAILDEAAEFGY